MSEELGLVQSMTKTEAMTEGKTLHAALEAEVKVAVKVEVRSWGLSTDPSCHSHALSQYMALHTSHFTMCMVCRS